MGGLLIFAGAIVLVAPHLGWGWSLVLVGIIVMVLEANS